MRNSLLAWVAAMMLCAACTGRGGTPWLPPRPVSGADAQDADAGPTPEDPGPAPTDRSGDPSDTAIRPTDAAADPGEADAPSNPPGARCGDGHRAIYEYCLEATAAYIPMEDLRSMEAGDVDGDGLADLAVTRPERKRVQILWGAPPAPFNLAHTLTVIVFSA